MQIFWKKNLIFFVTSCSLKKNPKEIGYNIPNIFVSIHRQNSPSQIFVKWYVIHHNIHVGLYRIKNVIKTNKYLLLIFPHVYSYMGIIRHEYVMPERKSSINQKFGLPLSISTLLQFIKIDQFHFSFFFTFRLTQFESIWCIP